jgi:hypothetical protein
VEGPPLHDALRPLAFLLGTWRGSGAGHYPGIDDFEYGEETRFWHNGKPVLAYSQRTWSLASKAPMHSETGYWRLAATGVEVVLAHAFGITEVLAGTIEGQKLTLASVGLTSAPTAKHVEAVSRTVEVTRDVLSYDVHMAFGEHDLQPHLKATLERAE